jgi:heterodisulfide reductase subunit B
MPVVYYSQLMTVAYGGGMKDAGLDGQVIPPPGLEKIIKRKQSSNFRSVYIILSQLKRSKLFNRRMT